MTGSMLNVMPRDHRDQLFTRRQVTDLRADAARYAATHQDERLSLLALECLFCGTQHGDERAVLACEETHYWSVVAGLAARERAQHLRDALTAAEMRGDLSPAFAAYPWSNPERDIVLDLREAASAPVTVLPVLWYGGHPLSPL